jgi:DNA-binding CsgD family transcriptional regulator
MRRALELLVVPIGMRRWMTSGPEVAVFVRDPERRVDAAPDMLRRLYGLTPAEAKLAASLMEGATLESAAEQFAISAQTVRSQLKQVFLKTRTNRQSELVRLLLGSPASLTSDPQGNPTTSGSTAMTTSSRDPIRPDWR